MSLVLGAITPHPPLLLPSIGKEKVEQLTQTSQAFTELEELLYSAKPDTVIIISPHGPITADAFYINLSQTYHSDLQEFGDMNTKANFSSDFAFVSELRDSLTRSSIPVSLIHQPNLDYGALVPLFFLLRHLPETKIIPVSYSFLDYETHYEFGRIMQQEILNTEKRIAIIASGDLSHRLTQDAPAGFSPRAQELDDAIIKHVQNRDHKSLITLDPALIKEGNECGLRSILILMGIFNSVNYSVRMISYEHPFGIGYLVASFDLQ